MTSNVLKSIALFFCLNLLSPLHAEHQRDQGVPTFPIQPGKSRYLTEKEEFAGSVKFTFISSTEKRRGVEDVTYSPIKTSGHGTLVKLEKRDSKCTYTFLTAAHVLTGLDGRYFHELLIATHAFSFKEDPILEMRFEIHPKIVLNEANNYRNDLALFSFQAPCPKSEVVPAKIEKCDPSGKTCYYSMTGNHWSNELPRRKEKMSISGMKGTAETVDNWDGFITPISEPQDAVFRSGYSGAGVFIPVDGEWRLMGCFVATAGAAPDMAGERRDSRALCHGSKTLEWAQHRLQQNEELATKITTSTRLNFPANAIYSRPKR